MNTLMKHPLLALLLFALAAAPLGALAGTETALVFTANTYGEHSPCPLLRRQDLRRAGPAGHLLQFRP